MHTIHRRQIVRLVQALLLLMGVAGQFRCMNAAPGRRAEDRIDSVAMSLRQPGHGGRLVAPIPPDSAGNNKNRPAFLGYAYPPRIHRKESHIFYAYVSTQNDEVRIKSRLRTDASYTEGKEAESDTIVVYPRDISFYRSIHLSLTDPAGDFKITPMQSSDTQRVDSQYGARWQWVLYTESDKPMGRLFLKAQGLQGEGAPDDLDDRSIPISIAIQTNILRTIGIYIADNPKVSVPAIIAFLGFIGWLIKRWITGGKKDEE